MLGFNKEKRVKCFLRALDHDPECTMWHGARLSAPGPSTISPGVSTGKRKQTRPPAMHHYAKAIAYTALKNFREAEKQRRLFQYIEPWAWMHPPAARAGGPADPAKQGGRLGSTWSSSPVTR